MRRPVLLALALAFCLGVTAAAGETIRVLCSTHALTNAMQKLTPDFEKETGIKVNFEVYGDEQVSQKLSVEFIAGNSTVDVFMIRPLQDTKVYYKNGWFEDLTSYYKDDVEYDFADFVESARNDLNINGFQCAIPISIETELLFYRKDWFEEKGIKVPTNFEELEAAAKALTDRENDRFGIVSRGSRSPLITMFSSYLYGFGGDWVDENGNAAIDTPEFREAAQFYGRLLREYGPPGAPNIMWHQALAIFNQGKAAMFTEGSTTYPQLLDPLKSSVADKTGVAVFPAGPKAHKVFYITCWGLCIAKQSPNKQAAWKFIRYMTDKERTRIIQGVYANDGARMSVNADPEGNKAFPPDYAKAMSETPQYGVSHDRPSVTAVQESRDIIGEAVVASIENKDFNGAVKIAHQRFQALLDREKAENK